MITRNRKDRIYKVFLCIDASVYDFIGAECGCPAGKGPYGSFKHFAAVSYALKNLVVLVNCQNLLLLMTACKNGTNVGRKSCLHQLNA